MRTYEDLSDTVRVRVKKLGRPYGKVAAALKRKQSQKFSIAKRMKTDSFTTAVDIKSDLAHDEDKMPEEIISAALGGTPLPKPATANELLEKAKAAALERADAIDKSKKEYETAAATKKIKREEELSFLPKKCTAVISFTVKDAKRYLTMLLGFSGKANAKFRCNHKEVAESYVDFLVREQKMSDVDMCALIKSVDKMLTPGARYQWLFNIRVEMNDV